MDRVAAKTKRHSLGLRTSAPELGGCRDRLVFSSLERRLVDRLAALWSSEGRCPRLANLWSTGASLEAGKDLAAESGI